MQITISVRHGHLPEETQKLLRDRATKLLRISDRLISVAITVDLANEGKCRVEVVATAAAKRELVAAATHEDLATAADLALEKLGASLRRGAEKLSGRRGKRSGQDRGDGLAIELYIDPGNASQETLRAVMEALSDMHRAAGGLGLEFTSDGNFVVLAKGATR